ncbi:hypothetical protein NPIL_401591 [Nephila pilipes]|uniref:G2/M phase-specific E3 ubiquitin-protein ligase n=1 Tax=Nephila pilipes TaxID=299642 RepID=A0A8X6PUP5_NEPPI|nr:hypothetical protein NPIL_401591 [Nephila pilipes]
MVTVCARCIRLVFGKSCGIITFVVCVCSLDHKIKHSVGRKCHAKEIVSYLKAQQLVFSVERMKIMNFCMENFIMKNYQSTKTVCFLQVEEVIRGKKLKCFHCKQNGATVGCSKAICRRTFHYPCGIKNHTLHQFFGTFPSYCALHKPQQKAIETPKEEFYCHICYLPLSEKDEKNCLYTSCCNHNWYHSACLQTYALSAGRYFFKCPLCNNSTDFISQVEFYGICVPEKDASWELEENAYQDLLYRPECGADNCYCADGRKYNGKSSWALLSCLCCGSVARHRCCANLKNSETAWKCEDCKVLEDKILKKKLNPQSSTEIVECSKQDSSNEKMPIFEIAQCSKQESSEEIPILEISLAVSRPSCSYASSNSVISTSTNNCNKVTNNAFLQSIEPQCEIKVTSVENFLKSKTEKTSNSESLKRKVKEELNINSKKTCLTGNILNQLKKDNPLNNQSLILPCNSVKTSNVAVQPKVIAKKRKTGKKFSGGCCSGNSHQCIKRMFGMECHNYRI